MKKTSLFVAAAFVLGIGSAFTKPLFTSAFANDGGDIISGNTEQSNCQIDQPVNCTMVVDGVRYFTVYDSPTAAQSQDQAHVLKFPG